MATSIRLDPAIEQRLDYLAAQTGRTKAYYLRELVIQGLDGRLLPRRRNARARAQGRRDGLFR